MEFEFAVGKSGILTFLPNWQQRFEFFFETLNFGQVSLHTIIKTFLQWWQVKLVKLIVFGH